MWLEAQRGRRGGIRWSNRRCWTFSCVQNPGSPSASRTRACWQNRGGELVTEPVREGLVREDGLFLYPVRDDIPIMLIDEAIPLEGTTT